MLAAPGRSRSATRTANVQCGGLVPSICTVLPTCPLFPHSPGRGGGTAQCVTARRVLQHRARAAGHGPGCPPYT